MEVVLGPVSVELMLEVMLWYSPGTVPVTFTENVQMTFAAVPVVASVAPLRLMVVEPATAVMVCPVMLPLAEQLGVIKPPGPAPLGVAMTRPSGRASVKLTLVKALEFGFVTVNVRVLGLVGMDDGEKLFESLGGLGGGQPVIVMSSRRAVAVLLAPSKVIRK